VRNADERRTTGLDLDAAPGALPNFLIVGAMRSGTTWLARCLAEHPSVFMTPGKEIHFFDQRHELGLDWYRAKFHPAEGEIAVGEATPAYMYDPDAVDRIADSLPDVRLLVVLRNPVERAYSHYCWNTTRVEEPLSFEDALDAEAARLRRDRDSRMRYSYVDRGRYALQLRRILGRFPRTSLEVVLLDDLQHDAGLRFDRTCDFLGVRTGIRPPSLGATVNAHHGFRSRRLHRLTRSVPQRGPGKAVHTWLWKVNRRAARPNPPMADAIRRRLRDEFRDDVAELGRMLGRDLSTWAM
jgi:Sulfotransferase domain